MQTLGANVDVYANREDWLASREADHSIGASEVASILGIGFATPWQVWHRRMNSDARQEFSDKMAGSEVVQRGHRWESAVVQEYAERSGLQTQEPWARVNGGFRDIVVLSNVERPWLRQTPDAFCASGSNVGQVEAKTALRRDGWSPDEGVVIDRWDDAYSQIVPPLYAVQAYSQMAVAPGLDWVDLCALVPTSTWLALRWVRILPDPDTQAEIVRSVDAWRQRHLIEGVEPPIDGTSECNQDLTRRFPSAKGARTATEEEAMKIRELAAIRAQMRTLDEDAKRISNELVRSSEGLRLWLEDAFGPYAQPQTQPGRITIAAKELREAHPEIAQQYCKIGKPFTTFNTYRL